MADEVRWIRTKYPTVKSKSFLFSRISRLLGNYFLYLSLLKKIVEQTTLASCIRVYKHTFDTNLKFQAKKMAGPRDNVIAEDMYCGHWILGTCHLTTRTSTFPIFFFFFFWACFGITCQSCISRLLVCSRPRRRSFGSSRNLSSQRLRDEAKERLRGMIPSLLLINRKE